MEVHYSRDIINASRAQYDDEQAVLALREQREQMGLLRRITSFGRNSIQIGRLEDEMRARSEQYPDLPPYMQIIDDIVEALEITR